MEKYKSPIDSRNLANNVENEVVEALTDSVTSNYKNISHRYYKIKAKLFNQENLIIGIEMRLILTHLIKR